MKKKKSPVAFSLTLPLSGDNIWDKKAAKSKREREEGACVCVCVVEGVSPSKLGVVRVGSALGREVWKISP